MVLSLLLSSDNISSVFSLDEVNSVIGGGREEDKRLGLGNSEGFTKGFFRLRFAFRTRCLNFSLFFER